MKVIYIAIVFILICATSYSQIGYINCTPFPSKCLVSTGDYDQTVKWLKKDTLWKDSISTLEEDFAGDYSFTTYIDPVESYPVFIIAFEEIPTDDLEGYLTVSHEVLHLMQFLYVDYSVDFSIEIESTAYLFEYLVNETFKVIRQ